MEHQTIYTVCRRCGRKLKSEESMKLGFGPGCYAKYIETKLKKKHLIEFGVGYDTVAGRIGNK